MRWMKFVPALNLGAGYNWTNSEGFSGENTSWNITLTLSVPLYDGGMRYAELREAQSQIIEAELNIAKIKRQLRKQIEMTMIAVDDARSSLISAQKQLELAREQSRLVHAQFEAGVVTSLEVSDATRVLGSAEVNVVRQELNLQMALLKLQKVLIIPPADSAVTANAMITRGGGDTSSASSSGGEGATESTGSTGGSTGGSTSGGQSGGGIR
jgi:outer membrane protein TolC